MKIWDIMPPFWWTSEQRQLKRSRNLVRKFFDGLETRGAIDGNQAILLVYNEQCPELSYIIKEQF